MFQLGFGRSQSPQKFLKVSKQGVAAHRRPADRVSGPARFVVAKQANASSVIPESASQSGRAPRQYALASYAFTNESSIFKVHKRSHSFCDITLAEDAERAEMIPINLGAWITTSVAMQSSQTKFLKVCGLVLLGRQELVPISGETCRFS